VILTLFSRADAAVLCAGDCDAELRRRFEFPDHFVPSLAHSEEVIAWWERERAAGQRYPYAVRNASTGELLGGCELRPVGDGIANLSYWIYPGYRRRGVASAAGALACGLAFVEFGFRALEVLIDPDNTGSRCVAARCGFREIGERDGRVVGVLEAARG
jgi:RimJ/RimL family protein N-acetyltransferase